MIRKSVKTYLVFPLLLFIYFISVSQGFTQRRELRESKKMKVVGTSQYLKYLNAGLDISRDGAPLKGLKIYLNELLLNERALGFYSNGTSYPYKMEIGKKIIITYFPNHTLTRAQRRIKQITLGVYRIDNYIEWVFPRPNTVISIDEGIGRTIRFRWHYVGRVMNTKVTVAEFKPGGKIIFTKNVFGESVNIMKSLFKYGMKYRFDLEVVGPMGHFRLTNYTTRDSKIDFYYWDHLYFQTQEKKRFRRRLP